MAWVWDINIKKNLFYLEEIKINKFYKFYFSL